VIGSSKKRFALWLVVAAATALLLVAGALSSPSEIETKQGEAAQVLDQIRQIDSDLDKAIDAYNGANERLSSLEEEIAVNRRHLAIARQAGKVAERNLERRLVELYQSGGGDSTLEILLGATSLDDLLDRIDTARRVSEQDAAIVEQVRAARAETARRQAKLAKALKAQQEAVAERAARKREIEARLAERQQLYASIEEEIEALQAAERRRQAQLARAAAARVASAAAAAPEGGSSEPIDAGGLGLAPPSQYSGAAGAALQFLGTPYVWGGSGPGGFDCSGLVQYAFAQVGVSLPHSSSMQYGYGVPVSRDQLETGDLVFFDGLGHVGIYIGDGQFVHSPHTGDVVKISSIYDSWYAATWVGARRIL
jgi:cell wall-associated NlpC family hydrolase